MKTIITPPTPLVLHTDGSGLWDFPARAVWIQSLQIDSDAGEILSKGGYVELRVYVGHIQKHGLIYTDKLFLTELRAYLKTLGFTDEEVSGVYYSEQGMQGDDYVSLDVEDEFVHAWMRLVR